MKKILILLAQCYFYLVSCMESVAVIWAQVLRMVKFQSSINTAALVMG